MLALRSPGERDRRAVDLAITAGVLALGVLNAIFTSAPEGPLAGNVVVVAVMALSFVWRSERTLLTVGIVCGGLVLLELALTPPPYFPAATLMLVLTSYSVALYVGRPAALYALVVLAGSVGLVTVLETPDDVAFPIAIFTVGPWLVGRALRSHTELARELAEKEALLAAAREGEASRAVALERSRVARELHDVLAHNLSVMVIQASAARRVLDHDPEAAMQSADLIRRSGREALAEMRHLFGAVRKGEGEDLLGSPGLAQVEGLVERARGAGLHASLSIHGEPRALAPGADMAAYRVIQEALTNTYKHAGPVRAAVAVRYEPDGLIVEVTDDGPGPGATEVDGVLHGGHGLMGMRERMALYGGELEAGRRRGGGFAVVARMPFEKAAKAVAR